MNVARASTPARTLSNGQPKGDGPPTDGRQAKSDERPDEGYDIRISADGTWFHEGTPIGRLTLVKLFASVLCRDMAGDYWLMTPAERGRITVEDAPFVAVAFQVEGQGEAQRVSFRTNLDQEIVAGPDHPIRVDQAALSGEPRPYILIRDRLDARIARSVFYGLVQIAAERTTPEGVELGIWSERTFFPLGTIPSD